MIDKDNRIIIIFTVLSGCMLIPTVVLLVLLFTNVIEGFWFTIPLALCTIFNLIAGIERLKYSRKMFKPQIEEIKTQITNKYREKYYKDKEDKEEKKEL